MGQLGGRQHPLVDDRARRERGDDQLVVRGQLGPAAGQEERTLEGVAVHPVGGGDEQLADHRRGLAGDPAGRLGADRDVPPGQDLHPHLGDLLYQQPLQRLAAPVVGRKEHDRHGIPAGLGEREVGHRPEEPVGDLHQHPGAVAGVGVGPFGAPVLHVGERGQASLDGLVRRDTIETGHQRDPTTIVLVSGVVKALHWPLKVSAWQGTPPNPRSILGDRRDADGLRTDLPGTSAPGTFGPRRRW